MEHASVVLSSGTVAFLFTDVAGSTRLWEIDRAAMHGAVQRQIDLLGTIVTAHGGVLYKVVGDGTQAAFSAAVDALGAAVDAQRALLAEPWPGSPGPLRVRMALHVGQATPRDGDHLAAALNRLARLLGAGHGGQILLTESARQLSRDSLPAGVVLRDLGAHRLRDLQEPEKVFQVVAPGLPDTFPPLNSLTGHPTNLTAPPTAIIGREAEITDVLRRFDAGARLVTMIGPGGSGKTRLAQEIAAEALGRFADGVFFVDLSPLRQAADVLPAVAVSLGVRENPGQPVREALSFYLSDRALLLVLDNFEQVLGAAADVGALLAACPRLAILATSREALRLRAEQVVRVAPLPVPEDGAPAGLAHLAAVPSVALFVERARAADPAFTLTTDNGLAVAAICRRLDGLPLAIELAAARVRHFPPSVLLARLQRSLPMLTGGPRDAPDRQRTLRQAIAWSYDLLGPEDQALFRALGVFVGGCTFSSAEAVAAAVGEVDIFAGLPSLCDQNLLLLDATGTEPRYRMLETIR
ncbi:MAG: adenylate/guanylate cyclase domain-containing protein, partial [Thermomicrobiales bacterium]|nr:adenylate/guanylate cyclase domain-containing protein [Thermomicrobiales bacterium]